MKRRYTEAAANKKTMREGYQAVDDALRGIEAHEPTRAEIEHADSWPFTHEKQHAELWSLLIDVKYALEKARIWNGAGYTYNSLPAFVYEPIHDQVAVALQPKGPTNVD